MWQDMCYLERVKGLLLRERGFIVVSSHTTISTGIVHTPERLCLVKTA